MENIKLSGDVRVLLISECKASVDHIERKLMRTMGIGCSVWQSASLKNAQNVMRVMSPGPDVIFIDINLLREGRPRDVFRQIDTFAVNAPIIVYDECAEHNISAYVISEGAADIVTRSQIEADPLRLRHAIESCLARMHSIRVIRAKCESEVEEATDRNSRSLRRLQEENARLMRERESLLSLLSGSYSVN